MLSDFDKDLLAHGVRISRLLRDRIWDRIEEERRMAKSSKPGLTTKGGKPALNVQVPADLKKASKKGEVK